MQPDLKILELMDNQPEFKTAIWDYLAALVDDQRVAGRPRRHAAMGQRAGQAEAASASIATSIAGVWGVESNFGKDIGGRPAGAVARDPVLLRAPPPGAISPAS